MRTTRSSFLPAPWTRRQALATAAGLTLIPWLPACSGSGKDEPGPPAPAASSTASPADGDAALLGRSYGDERLMSRQLDPSLVHLVARGQGTPHLLMRGNAPTDGGRFEYDALVAALREAAGGAWPGRFRIVDVSLMNDLVESDALEAERQFWAAHPQQGRFIHHPIYGALTDPADYPGAARRAIERWQGLDRMDELVRQLHDLLQAPAIDGVAEIVFVHCRAGRDRTGQVIASYGMRHLSRSYREAMQEAERIAGRALGRYSRYGIAWQAHKLADREGVPTIGPIP